VSAAIDRRRLCGTLLHLGSATADTAHGRFRSERFLDLSSRGLVLVLSRGELRGEAPLLARVHSSCMTSETFRGCDCDCAGQLDAALQTIAAGGRGVVFYLLQEGRGAGFVAKARDRMMVQASRDQVTTFDAYARMGLGRDYRRYDTVSFAAAALGITTPFRLLTNNPEKVSALRRAGVAIAQVLPLERAASPFNRHYLAAKSRSGHALRTAGPAGTSASLPEPVAYFEPHPLTERPRFERVASYLLPIRGRAAVHWFRLHAYFDLRTQRERVLFTYLRDPSAMALVRTERESLLARFRPRTRSRAASWFATVEHIVRRGAGAVLFMLHDDPAAAAASGAPAAVAADDDLAWLLAQHVPHGRGELLLDGRIPHADERALQRALERHGVAVA
jgi:3,4-dihydroxy 2-butanone 4-phosphate synthase/GTP cyclohydrolase II